MKGQLLKKIFLKGKIRVLTGLHIGGTGVGFEIGGIDNVVIRDPITNIPYIPGSSLKGKMRALLEKLKGQYCKDGKPYDKQDELCGKLFGTAGEDKATSRLIVRDSFMDEESVRRLEEANTDLPFTEVKTEVAINRITADANPRQMERVPAGTSFDFEMILNVFEEDDEKELLQGLFEAMTLLQDDYLGGSGTRGYGKVKFEIKSVTYKTEREYEENKEAKTYEIEIPEALK